MEPGHLSKEERSQLNKISGDVISCAIKVHSLLGPGLLESTHEACLEHELRLRHHKVLRQVGLPGTCEGINLEVGYRIDLLVDDQIVVELKASEGIGQSIALNLLLIYGSVADMSAY